MIENPNNLRGEIAPLYCRLNQEIRPQGAYIEIDEDGVVSAELAAARATAGGCAIDGDMEQAILAKLWRLEAWPSDLARDGRWVEAGRLVRHWEEAAAAGCLPRLIEADASALADAIETLLPETMDCLDGFEHADRREVVASGTQAEEAEATLAEGLREIRERLGLDLFGFPRAVARELVARRVAALDAWVAEHPEGGEA